MPKGALNIGCKEHLDPAGTGSFYNEGEADIVTQQVLNLVHCGIYTPFTSLLKLHIVVSCFSLHIPFIFYIPISVLLVID
jgi:hypothetical protein